MAKRTNESFNGKFRDECLSVEWFRSRPEAAVIIEIWRRHYNAVRPHSSIAYWTPLEFKQQHQPIPNPSRPPRMNGPKLPGQVRRILLVACLAAVVYGAAVRTKKGGDLVNNG